MMKFNMSRGEKVSLGFAIVGLLMVICGFVGLLTL